MSRGKERQTLKDWLPTPVFDSLESLDRIKRQMLGLPIPKIGPNYPWGYVQSTTDPDWLIPNERAFLALVQSKRYLRDCTYAVASDWLTEAAGVSITGEGLRKLMRMRPPLDIIPYTTIEEREELAHSYGRRIPDSLRGKASCEQERGTSTEDLYKEVAKAFS